MILQAGVHQGKLMDAHGMEISDVRWANTETGVVRVLDRKASQTARAAVEREEHHAAPLQWHPSAIEEKCV